MDNTEKRVLHVRGQELRFTVREHPFASVAGIRFLREHEGAIAAGLTAGLDAMPPGVLSGLMLVLLDGPHGSVNWEYDVPAVAVLALIATCQLPDAGTAPKE